MRAQATLAGFSLALITSWMPAHAHACSWLARAISSSLPASGAVDVPLDVAPVIRGHGQPGALVWETLDGIKVEFDWVDLGRSASFTEGNALELVPRTHLQPHATYVIRARLDGAGALEERITFTTGQTVADNGALARPSLAASVLTIAPSMCTSATEISCIAAGEAPVLLEISDAMGNSLVGDVVTGDLFTYISGPSCIRISTRSASGQLSEATELCGSALPIRAARSGELDGTHPCERGAFQPNEQGTATDTSGVVAGPSSADADANESAADVGCAVSQLGRANLGFSALAILFPAAALAGRRRRRVARYKRE
jgi:hypothetical protein